MSTTTQCAAMYDGGVFYPKHKDCPDCDRCVQMAHGGPSARLTFPAQIVPAATGSGEPFPVCTECGKKVTVSWESHADECTPPASQPTVTLDRAVYDMVKTALTSLEGLLVLTQRQRCRASST